MTREEFNKYVRLTGQRLYSLAFRILRKQDDAEDAVQEVFVRMWRMGDKLDDYSNMDALATTMTKNYCIDQLRKTRRIEPESVLNDKPGALSTEEVIENAESYIIILNVIESLPENLKILISLRDVEGISYEEIAEKTGQNINTVRVNLSRARAMVRKEYNKYFDEKRRN